MDGHIEGDEVLTFEAAWKILNYDEGPLLDTARPLMFKDAHLTYKSGMPLTATEQAKTFVAILKKFTDESRVFRDLVVEIVKCCKQNEIILYFGKYSVACFDSAAGWEVDMDDYLTIPPHPYKCPETGHMIGILQGEMIIHLLEERLYMKRPGQDFTRSHMKCLSKGSFQNRYRLEMGCSFEALSFDLLQHTSKNTVHEHSNWEGVDAFGHLMTVQNINSGKMLNKFHRGHTCDYKPTFEQVQYSKINITTFIDRKIKDYHSLVKTSYTRTQAANEEDVIGLDFWLKWKITTDPEYRAMKLMYLGPFTIGPARKKTWNVLRVALRQRMYTAHELIALGRVTFLQNYKEPIPEGWKTLEYAVEPEIVVFKLGIKKNFVALWQQSEDEANRIVAAVEEHF